MESLNIRTLFEDQNLLYVEKPSGIHSETHPLSELSVESLVQAQPGMASLKLLHRLDQGTSGVLVFSKAPEHYEAYRKLWQQHEVQKIYLACTTSLIQEKLPLEIKTPLAHSAKNKKKMILVKKDSYRGFRGKPLSTHTIIHSLSRKISTQKNPQILEYEIEIKTGVMHQIRVHLASLGAPILGDLLYGGASFERLLLHAHKIKIPGHPEVTSPLPSDWPGISNG